MVDKFNLHCSHNEKMPKLVFELYLIFVDYSMPYTTTVFEVEMQM